MNLFITYDPQHCKSLFSRLTTSKELHQLAPLLQDRNLDTIAHQVFDRIQRPHSTVTLDLATDAKQTSTIRLAANDLIQDALAIVFLDSELAVILPSYTNNDIREPITRRLGLDIIVLGDFLAVSPLAEAIEGVLHSVPEDLAVGVTVASLLLCIGVGLGRIRVGIRLVHGGRGCRGRHRDHFGFGDGRDDGIVRESVADGAGGWGAGTCVGGAVVLAVIGIFV